MYESYWGLKEKPFENTPDPRFLYYSPQHEEALIRLLYAVRENKGGALVTGEYGSGKTVLSRVLMGELGKEKYSVGLITHPQLTPLQFLKEIVYQLGEDRSSPNKAKVLHLLQDMLYANMEKGKDTVVIIDEAQLIKGRELFEELRLLLNFQLNDRFLLTLIFLGQPELRPKIEAIPQLKQRLGVRYHLSTLDEVETGKYISHRLKVAGGEEKIFTEEAKGLTYRYSGGTPRRINNICDMSLLIGFGEKVKRIGEEIVKKIAQDLEEKCPD